MFFSAFVCGEPFFLSPQQTLHGNCQNEKIWSISKILNYPLPNVLGCFGTTKSKQNSNLNVLTTQNSRSANCEQRVVFATEDVYYQNNDTSSLMRNFVLHKQPAIRTWKPRRQIPSWSLFICKTLSTVIELRYKSVASVTSIDSY